MAAPGEISFDGANEANTGLLDAELPDPRFVDATYLRWLYDENPLGAAWQGGVDDEAGVRVAHYALIPQEYRDATRRERFVFSLNAVTRSGAQRKGWFSEIGLRIWARARDEGVRCIIGVTNARSVKPVQRQGWRLLGPMATRVVPPSPALGRGFDSAAVGRADLDAGRFDDVLAGLDESPARHWTNCWTPEYLRWRLAPANGPGYALHVDERLVAVSTRAEVGGVPVAVLLKLLPRHGRSGPISGHGAAAAACRHHRTPLAVYAGYNRHVVLRGLRVPERFKPAPLNLMVCSLDEGVDQASFRLDTFELLDMDAY